MNLFKDLEDCKDWIYSKKGKNNQYDLESVKLLLDKIDNPQDKIKVIHIAGTNGKGSTSNYIYSALSRKIRCGLFISPYMFEITDSIKINGKEISTEEFIAYASYLEPLVSELEKNSIKLSYFEILTAIMFKYFYDKRVDCAVIEVGLGGTLDSTNVIKNPTASVITTISLDHMNVLGNSLYEIAQNKAGIIKNASPVFVYPQEADIMDLFREKCKENNCPLFSFDKEEIEILEASEEGNLFNFRNFKNIETGLLGKHQIYNSCLAITVLDYFKKNFHLEQFDILEGIKDSSNPGRLQILSKNPKILLDGAHNKESIDALLDTIKYFKYDRLIVGFSMLKDKDVTYSLSKLSKIANKLIITSLDYQGRAYNMDEFEGIAKKFKEDVICIEDRLKAFDYTLSLAKESDLVLWCGSLYLMRDLLNYCEKQA